ENRQVELDYLEARAFVDLDRNMRGGIVTMTCRLAVLDGAGGLQRQGETCREQPCQDGNAKQGT
ncbi:MAG TPA: hypothetical protein PLY73_15385, partial [Candidatus Ozemobacteraceae bacterium]|nr:hypothetical protein [Candidatus Ozemobacteraceae bacterium]